MQFILCLWWCTTSLSIVKVVIIWLAYYCRAVLEISSSNFFKIKKKPQTFAKCILSLLIIQKKVSLNFNCLKNVLCRNLPTSMWNLVFLSGRLAFRSSECKILVFTEALCLNHCKTKCWAEQDCFSSVFFVPSYGKPWYFIL